MNRYEAREASGIVDRMLESLLASVPSKDRATAEARAQINYTRLQAFPLLMADEMGPELDSCFIKSYDAGVTMQSIVYVLQGIAQEEPKYDGAKLVMNSGIILCLVIEGYLIRDMTFVNRTDVENLQNGLKQPFADMEEIAADSMDSITYQALIRLHAAITNHLVKTSLPLPRLVNYKFYEPIPSLVLSYRLYDDAGRADEVRKENRIVHPAFCPTDGRALSA